MTTVLYKDEWVTLTFDAALGLARYERSDVAYGGEGEIERSYAGIGAVVLRTPPGMKLLLDVRRAPPRNDEAYEAKVNSVFDTFVGRFAKHAVLVRTAVGKLQTARLASARGAVAHVFDDERAALEYLGIGAAEQKVKKK